MNEDKYNEIKSLLGDEFDLLKEVYRKDTLERLQNIELTLVKQDLTEIRLLAHAMKSSSANIGADEVSILAAKIESYAIQEDSGQIRDLIPTLKKAVEDTLIFMNN